MKKLLLSLILAVLIGVGFSSLGSASQVGNELSPYRTIKLNVGVSLASTSGQGTLIVAHGGVLRYISARSTASSGFFAIYDASSVAAATQPGTTGGLPNSQYGILIEGGQATSGNSTTIDLGDAGINFVNGLVIVTGGTSDVSVLYY